MKAWLREREQKREREQVQQEEVIESVLVLLLLWEPMRGMSWEMVQPLGARVLAAALLLFQSLLGCAPLARQA